MKGSLFFLLAIFLTSCGNNPHLYEKYYGIYIDHYGRQGSGYKDSAGTTYGYYYVRTVITNDSLIPAHVILHFPNKFYQTNFSNYQKYKVFLLPDSMMTTENKRERNNLVGGKLKKFFDSGLKNSFILDTVLKPKETFTIYIGFITKSGQDIPSLSLFSRGHKPHFWPTRSKKSLWADNERKLSIPDSAINRFIQVKERKLSVFLGVSILNSLINEQPVKYFNIIPCGEIFYSNK